MFHLLKKKRQIVNINQNILNTTNKQNTIKNKLNKQNTIKNKLYTSNNSNVEKKIKPNIIAKNCYNLQDKNIMFISPDVYWDMCWGNSIWGRCFVSLLNKKYNSKITVYDCARLLSGSSKIYNNKIDSIKYINMFDDNFSYAHDISDKYITETELIKFIISQKNDYDYIIVRGISLMNKLANYINNVLLDKIIYIVVDRPSEYNFINKIKNTFHMTLIRYITEKQNTKIPQYIIPPLLIDENIYNTNYSLLNTQYDICIVGTIYKDSNLDNILNIINKLNNIKIIIAGKIVNNFIKEMDGIILKFQKNKNIIFNVSWEGISEQDSHNIILKSKIGMRYDKPIECLSSKVMNYICFNRLLIVQDIYTHKYLLSENYPFYINKDDILCNKLFYILNNMTEDKVELAKKLINDAKNKINPGILLKNNFQII